MTESAKLSEDVKIKIGEEASMYSTQFDYDKRPYAEDDFYKGAEFGYQLGYQEAMKEENQKNLWDELESYCMGYDEGSGGFLVINEAQRRFHIIRKPTAGSKEPKP